MGFLDFLRKTGMLQSGVSKGTYKNAAEAPQDVINNAAGTISGSDNVSEDNNVEEN